MSTVLKQPAENCSRQTFAAAASVFMVMAWVLTATAPVTMSIGIVFLFAGPHNYVESRYFLTRLPARMGRLKPFFMVSAVGVISLTIAFPLLTRLAGWMRWSPQSVLWTIGLWNTALILWVTSLVWLRSLQPPKKNWDYALPIGLAFAGLAWLQPILLPLLMVFLHPLMGLWVLDREIAKSRQEWQTAYRCCVGSVPVLLVLLWTFGPAAAADALLPEQAQAAKSQVIHHAGATIVTIVDATRLVATHAFLELLHYGVWMLAVPVASGRVFSEGFRSIPLMKRSDFSRRLIGVLLAASAAVVVLLWVCFTADYTTTRDVYFTVAMLHVLAEIPFLLRLL